MDETTKTIEYLFSARGLISVADVFLLLVTLFYVIYAFMLTRQVKLLNKSYSSPLSGLFNQAAFIHLVASIAVAVLALVGIF